jgi:hypothetical protein
MMVADGYRQHLIKSGDGNGGCNGDSKDDSNGMTATATTINSKWQQKNWRRRLWQWWRRWKRRQWQWKLWWQQRQSLHCPSKRQG